ncbi:MAG: M64 family metallopeptidase [Thermoanaerobaculia bacterium]|nr:M64 family metallopeptidase [Thermoanaerobaculia bacterium]
MRTSALFRRTGWLALALLLAPTLAAADFDDDFTGATLRLDFFHTGDATRELVAFDRLKAEGPWPGSRTWLLDDTNLGKYFFEIVDLDSHRVLYSRGFASIYGEWETTAEARERVRALPEALRFPEPRRPFQVRLRKRADDQSFREIWSDTFDPASRHVDRAPVAPRPVRTLLENGDPAGKVDLLILGDGYTEAELARFHTHADELLEALFRWPPFSERKSDFNVRAIDTPAALSGISRPRSGLYRDSPLGATYNIFDSERYVLTLDDRAWRDVAAAAPYDFVVILVNSEKYGGGGIYQLYATAAAGSGFADYLAVHEFGHSFAALADEYYTSSVAYEAPEKIVEPWEPNVTALHDPERLKWRDLATEGTPIPTPWSKERFEAESNAIQEERRRLRAEGAPEERLEELFRRERALMTELLGAEEHADEVGAFEGASYQPEGLYRPAADCIMFTRDEVGFCAVCRRAIERVIDLYSRDP